MSYYWETHHGILWRRIIKLVSVNSGPRTKLVSLQCSSKVELLCIQEVWVQTSLDLGVLSLGVALLPILVWPQSNQAAHSPLCVRDMKCERSPISDQVTYVPWTCNAQFMDSQWCYNEIICYVTTRACRLLWQQYIDREKIIPMVTTAKKVTWLYRQLGYHYGSI